MPETPTRRKPGPPKTKDYTTVSLKLPTALLQQAKRYALIHRRPVSELFRDGLVWRIGEGDPLAQHYGLSQQDEQENNGNTVIPDEARWERTSVETMLAEIRTALQTLTQALPQRTNGLASPVDPGEQRREAAGVTAPEATPIRSRARPPVKQARVDPIPARACASPGLDQGEASAPPVDCPSYDASKYRLGRLCPRGHEWGTTGQSLRVNNRAGYCLTCNATHARARRQAGQPGS